MVNQNLNDQPDPIEDSIRNIELQPLSVSVGEVMYESGRAVGREEALSEHLKSSRQSIRLWQFTTVAAIAFAMFGFADFWNQSSGSLEPEVAQQPFVGGDAMTLDNQLQNDRALEGRTKIPEWQYVNSKPTRPINPGTLIGIRNRLSSHIFQNDSVLREQKVSAASPKIQSAFELMKRFNDSGTL